MASLPRVGIWLVGACGGVGTCVALGLAALQRKLIDDTGLTTSAPPLHQLALNTYDQFVVGGHEIRKARFLDTVEHFQERSGIFSHQLVEACTDALEIFSENIAPGTLIRSGETIQQLCDWDAVPRQETPGEAIARLKDDLALFQMRHQLSQVVVINVSSTEPPAPLGEVHQSLAKLQQAFTNSSEPSPLPASSLYAWAAIESGMPYVNFTPSLGAHFPAFKELMSRHNGLTAGQDGKTGETLLKSAIAPMFLARNLHIHSWVGHNVFGNRDGLVLNDPRNKESKVKNKDQIISSVVGYKPQTHVSIEYIESLDDWKTAWNHIHFSGFLGIKMVMQLIWQGCDSILAAPLVIDLARLSLYAQRQGETGTLHYLAPYFKAPLGVENHDFFHQLQQLHRHFFPE
ncbi:MAG TPA: inositol-3-phosphate synthase [Gemmatales bacterium]|nr:inositol-3-phosphate synthase [Gemmatales bacterium]HMP18458.1 inositol-3-phosphate synthase [Gemmatales bacterium]